MQDNYESVLSDALLMQESCAQVAKSLIQRLKTETTRSQERRDFVRFLIHAGFYKEVFSLYAAWFQNKSDVPLHEFLHVLDFCGVKPDEDFFSQLKLAQEYSQEKDRVQYCAGFQDKPLVQTAQKNRRAKAERDAKDVHEKWVAQVLYLQSQRMIDEEKKLLNMLLEMYPEDAFFKEQTENLQERWALATIAKKSEEKTEKLLDTEPRFTKEQLEFADTLLKAEKEIVQNKPQYSYDFAIGFYFMELFEHASEILSFANTTPAVDWFFAEILLNARRHVECLDALETLENKYANDPETAFAITYYRAMALHGLGQVASACQLLRSLVTVRPNYRSSHELLLKWTGVT